MNHLINVQAYKTEEPLLTNSRPESTGYNQPGDVDKRVVEIPAVAEKCPVCGNDFLKEDAGFIAALLCCCASKSKRKIWKTCVYCGVRF